MRRRFGRVTLLAVALVLLWMEAAFAFTYFAPVPQGTVGWARPRIVQRFNLEPGDRIVAAEMWLDGRPVTPAWDDTGLVYYDPPGPLEPGAHHVRLTVRVVPGREGYVYAPVTSEFTITVTADAPAVLPPAGAEGAAALAAVNRYRLTAGVSPVVLDARLSAAAALQASYLVANPDQVTVDAHRQTPSTPGFVAESAAGRARYYAYDGGTAEVINFKERAEEAVAGWIDTLYHRVPLLHPGMREMGYGLAGDDGLTVNVAVLGPYTSADQTVRWPAPGQTGVPPLWDGLETPDPLAGTGLSGPVGYPITLTFGARPEQLRLTRWSLTEPDGPVTVLPYDPERDPNLEDTVALIPTAPLRPGAQYTVAMAGEVDLGSGRQPFDYSWTFRTAAEAHPVVSRRVITYQADGSVAHIRLEGHAFPVGVQVYLGGLPVAGLVRESASSLRFQLPQGYPGGPADLLLVTPGGHEVTWPEFLTGAEPLSPSPAQAFRQVPLVVRGQPQGQPALVHGGGAVLVPGSALLRWELEPEQVTAIGRTWWRQDVPSALGEYTLGRVIASVGGRPVRLALPVQERLGQIYVDASFAAALIGAELRQVGGQYHLVRPVGGQYDVDGHWAEAAIARLLEDGVVSGYGDGTFRPNATLSRAAFVRMLVSALGLQGTGAPGQGAAFADTAGHWVATGGYLGAAVTAGIVRPEDYPGGRFDPDRAILREEIAVMLVRALGLEERALATPLQTSDGVAVIEGRRFTDAGQWQRPRHVAEAIRSGLIAGYAEAEGAYTFRPDRTATRAEAAAMLVRALGEGG